ncbi:Chloride channel protein [Gracilaria domingensis]|nr:Chloride channel protein [Gracilaria domingensis]
MDPNDGDAISPSNPPRSYGSLDHSDLPDRSVGAAPTRPLDASPPLDALASRDSFSAIVRPGWAVPDGSGDTSAFVLSRASFDGTLPQTAVPMGTEPPRRRTQLMRHGSRGPFSRLRLRTTHQDSSAGFAGDYIIHDFINDRTRSQIVHREKLRAQGGASAQYMYRAKMYFVLVVMGIGAGMIAAGLDLQVEWLSDIKFGLCTRGWFLTREMCCKLDEKLDRCPYMEWSALLGFLPWPFVFSTPVREFIAYTFFAVMFGVISAFLVKRFAPHAAGSGVPEIKTVLSGVVIKGYLSSWAFIVKIIGLAFSVASSLNLGKEGPFVHLVSVLANMMASRFAEFRENNNLMLEFVTVGTAAGVSVAFNAPIGGVLFAFEEAASYFPNRVLWRSFFASALAELTLKLLNPFFNGKAVMFEVQHSLGWYWFEMIAFFIIGALGGVLGSIFIHYNVKWSKLRIHDPWLKRSPIKEVALVVLATVLLQYPIPFFRLTNTEILTVLFSECSETGSNGENAETLMCDSSQLHRMFAVLVYGVFAKLFLTILTFGARIPAGLFIPSMTIGACAGRIVGMLMKLATERYPDFPLFAECSATSVCVRPSIYALVGASSTLAGVTQVSVSLVVIMFELTGGLSHVLPNMFGILAAKMVCNMTGLEGIYDMHITIKRYPFLDSKHHVSHDMAAREIMREPRVVLPEKGTTLGHLKYLLHSTEYYGFPIVRDQVDMILTGNIVRAELMRAIKKAEQLPGRISDDTAVLFKGSFDSDGDRDLIDNLSTRDEIALNFAGFRDRYLSQVAPETPISDLYACFAALGVRMCYVTQSGRLQGLISKKDIIAFCDARENVPKKYF